MQAKASVVTLASEPTSVSAQWSKLRQQGRAITVVAIVEPAPLLPANEADEANVIDRWRRFVNGVRTAVLPNDGGRLVKSLGDGQLLAFASVTEAVQCAIAIQRFNASTRRATRA